jgi:hypothetical protein
MEKTFHRAGPTRAALLQGFRFSSTVEKERSVFL